jgi:predicted O-methyltransferase YrrM
MKYVDPEIKGMMHIGDLRWLFGNACKMNSIVEIGCWMGKSTHALLSGCKGMVYAVDNWEGSCYDNTSSVRGLRQAARELNIYERFVENVGHFENLTILKMISLEAVSEFEDKSIDMVFIDGEHRYPDVYADIGEWLPKTVKLICGHDHRHEPVERAVKDWFGEDYNLTPDNIWYKKL